ncbi:polyketide cyclase [Mycolicibacterium madagascariense]|uniref:Polyketide cyclase n=1 Tax=Mycolicibacterium madagascariense TaxID=212765 RepID=A0A7I7XAY4_9MYCO|nr:SRPBCC family protein [Mycolicibacterium madagascariense]MCV7014152.1 SRPBCC family protein [Mycolicibacterium madagascariense]BBZ25761.1 polyketide cyclase [Mycolicibacterium madagascariense]
MTALDFHDSVVVHVEPDRLYELVSDVTRMGEWSPQCRACWWDEGAGPTVGSYFTGRNDDGKRTWETRSRVVAADPGREFAWVVNDGWVRWGFTIDAVDGGSRLTEWWAFQPEGIQGFHDRFGEHAEHQIEIRSTAAHAGIPVTLAAIKRTAEGG